jgi:hypothetical protein
MCPEDCEYDILHVLDPFDLGGLHRRERRSGKTTELVRVAIQLADYGYVVYYVTKNHDMARRAQDTHRSACRVKFMGPSDFARRTMGFAPGLVVTDELNPDEVKSLHIEQTCHSHVGGFYSD